MVRRETYQYLQVFRVIFKSFVVDKGLESKYSLETSIRAHQHLVKDP